MSVPLLPGIPLPSLITASPSAAALTWGSRQPRARERVKLVVSACAHKPKLFSHSLVQNVAFCEAICSPFSDIQSSVLA